jgi:hypothetical protein
LATAPGGAESSAELTLRELVTRLSDELGALSRLTAGIERALPQGAIASGAASARELQELDRLRQTLDDLGQLTGELAQALPADRPLPAHLGASLRLRSLAERLFGQPGASSGAPGDEAGTLTLL